MKTEAELLGIGPGKILGGLGAGSDKINDLGRNLNGPVVLFLTGKGTPIFGSPWGDEAIYNYRKGQTYRKMGTQSDGPNAHGAKVAELPALNTQLLYRAVKTARYFFVFKRKMAIR